MTAAPPSNGRRFAARSVAGGGTPVGTWLAWKREFPALDLDECPALILVAPHPDDETLGFGATAATLRTRGVDVRVVSVTDGGGAYPNLSPLERTWLEKDRRAELHRATGILGLDPPICLGMPDGRLAEFESALADILSGMLEQAPAGSWCAATWRGDGHPDHEAVGRAAAVACGRTAATLLEYPLWMWHWAEPDDDAVPWERMAKVAVEQTAIMRKRNAAKVFRTQLAAFGPDGEPVVPIVPPFVVKRLITVGEAVFR